MWLRQRSSLSLVNSSEKDLLVSPAQSIRQQFRQARRSSRHFQALEAFLLQRVPDISWRAHRYAMHVALSPFNVLCLLMSVCRSLYLSRMNQHRIERDVLRELTYNLAKFAGSSISQGNACWRGQLIKVHMSAGMGIQKIRLLARILGSVTARYDLATIIYGARFEKFCSSPIGMLHLFLSRGKIPKFWNNSMKGETDQQQESSLLSKGNGSKQKWPWNAPRLRWLPMNEKDKDEKSLLPLKVFEKISTDFSHLNIIKTRVLRQTMIVARTWPLDHRSAFRTD